MGKFKVAILSRVMQWSVLTEEKQKNELAQKKFRFNIIILITNNNERQLPDVLRLYIRIALQQKTANFKVAPESRGMQGSRLTEGKHINQLAQ